MEFSESKDTELFIKQMTILRYFFDWWLCCLVCFLRKLWVWEKIHLKFVKPCEIKNLLWDSEKGSETVRVEWAAIYQNLKVGVKHSISRRTFSPNPHLVEATCFPFFAPVWIELQRHMLLQQGPRFYIPLESTCCLVTAYCHEFRSRDFVLFIKVVRCHKDRDFQEYARTYY